MELYNISEINHTRLSNLNDQHIVYTLRKDYYFYDNIIINYSHR